MNHFPSTCVKDKQPLRPNLLQSQPIAKVVQRESPAVVDGNDLFTWVGKIKGIFFWEKKIEKFFTEKGYRQYVFKDQDKFESKPTQHLQVESPPELPPWPSLIREGLSTFFSIAYLMRKSLGSFYDLSY